MRDVVPRCPCGHAQQVHGADRPGGPLTHNGRRNSGPCSVAGCICDNYTPRKNKKT